MGRPGGAGQGRPAVFSHSLEKLSGEAPSVLDHGTPFRNPSSRGD